MKKVSVMEKVTFQRKGTLVGDLYESHKSKMFSDEFIKNAIETPIKIDSFLTHKISHLEEWIGAEHLKKRPNIVIRSRLGPCVPEIQYEHPIVGDQYVQLDLIRRPNWPSRAQGFIRAGPRKEIVWDSKEVTAAIVTCGGLCPGINDCIEGLVKTLSYNYGVDTILGIKNGFRGFYQEDLLPYKKLTPENVKGIKEHGGTILGSSRGGFDLNKIINMIIKHKITQIYCIGGDGTHRGANAIFDEIIKHKLKITVVAIPKTIDNDIAIIDRSFGFRTAVEEAERAIISCRVEAECSLNGIGVVKLMGRKAGYLAAVATSSAQNVDLCLIPEIPFVMEGKDGILEFLHRVIKKQGNAVVVVAEGAGSQALGENAEKDESGNPRLHPVGLYLKDEINKYFKKQNLTCDVKYHDPSYMIRSLKANTTDSRDCFILSQMAVHAAMFGYTGCSVGIVNNRPVYIPLNLITQYSPSAMNIHGHHWETVLLTTFQPDWMPKE